MLFQLSASDFMFNENEHTIISLAYSPASYFIALLYELRANNSVFDVWWFDVKTSLVLHLFFYFIVHVMSFTRMWLFKCIENTTYIYTYRNMSHI